MRRGRPPYPDVLTPREQEVHALLREGLTNQQIADRLGISLYGARYHVSEILSKLGVSSREEAARWQPEKPPRRWSLGVLLAPFGKLAGVSAYKLAAGATIGAAGVALGLLALGVLVSGMREGPELPEGLGKIVYVQDGNLMAIEMPHGKAELVTGEGVFMSPRWSTSGEWLLVDRIADQNRTTSVVMRETGEDLRELDATQAEWSPTSDEIALVSEAGDVRVESPDGVKRIELLDSQTAQGRHPNGRIRWSPDGQWLAVALQRRAASAGESYSGIWIVRPDGTEARTLVALPEPEAGLLVAGWSADGSTLFHAVQTAYSASMVADGLTWVPHDVEHDLNLAPGQVTRLPTISVLDYGDYVAYSPDRTRTAVVNGGGRESWRNKTLTIFESPDPLSNYALTDDPLTDPDTAATSPQWSPDGLSIAYVAHPASDTPSVQAVEQRRIWITDPQGTNHNRLTENDFPEEAPQWSRDGRYILYVRPGAITSEGQATRASLWLFDIETDTEIEVLAGLDYDLSAAGPRNIFYFGHYQWNALFDWWQPLTRGQVDGRE